MNDALRLPVDAAAADPGRRLRRDVALLAGRLARLMKAMGGGDKAFHAAHAFLWDMVDAHAGEAVGLGVPHPLDRLVSALGLTAMEQDLLLLAAMPEEHEGYASALRTLHPRGEGRPVLGLAAQLLCAESDDRLALRRQLLDGAALNQGLLSLAGDGPFFEQELRLAPGLWGVLGGIDRLPAPLQRLSLQSTIAGLEDWLADPSVRLAARAFVDPAPRAIVVAAETEQVAAERAAALCASAGVEALALAWPADASPALLRLARLHALARGAVLLLRVRGAEEAHVDAGGLPGAMLLCQRRGAASATGDLPAIPLAVDALTASARERTWRAALPELAEAAPTLALRYAVEPAAVERIAQDLRSVAALSDAPLDLDDVAAGVRARAQATLAPGLDVRRPRAGWNQLVLAPDRKAQLVEAVQRLEHQATVLDDWRFLDGRSGARGVRLLLAGPPGTGKTLAAEVLASELGVDLLVVDIARLVSKWIGETEKHLAAVFDVAEQAQAVLLFDEADALFGKRTDVSDAHDRYANLETAYLLARLERFEGLAILSTNLKHNIDTAFLRRLEFVVDFDLPAAAERAELWRCHLPPRAPLSADVDLRGLAQAYPISGGLIRNAAVAAGFRAAAHGSAITQSHLVAAIAREYDKSGKSFPGIPTAMATHQGETDHGARHASVLAAAARHPSGRAGGGAG